MIPNKTRRQVKCPLFLDTATIDHSVDYLLPVKQRLANMLLDGIPHQHIVIMHEIRSLPYSPVPRLCLGVGNRKKIDLGKDRMVGCCKR